MTQSQRPDRNLPSLPDVMHMQVAIRVPTEEMKEWEPERIERFFEGIAQTVKAANDE